ncbi:GtrA family protein [Martelella alba]|uniref:GtrA family protein n=1 Tax=Martelella alba TaxID=2590451 RepID=A0ABY2SL46_9HYPH|nr:GtrA family protein [Martelella alba]
MTELYRSQLVKYCLVGAVNTLVCALVIFLLMYLGCSIYISNVFGYIAGVVFSYLLNSIFTFSNKISLQSSFRFLISVLLSYFVNLIVITVALYYFPENHYTVQLFGMIAYTLVGFVINKKWAMK